MCCLRLAAGGAEELQRSDLRSDSVLVLQARGLVHSELTNPSRLKSFCRQPFTSANATAKPRKISLRHEEFLEP